MKSRAGFSLLEALVALAIAAVCLVPLMALQRQIVDGQRRHEQALRRAELQRNALTLLRDVNPSVEPEGERDLPPDVQITWTSTPVTEPKLSAGFPSGDGTYTVQLFRLDAQVIKAGQLALPPIQIERVGWSQGQSAPAASAAPTSGPGRGGR